MKTNKKHIIIPALMMAVGLGLVGSISGTVAWYQYSTRVTTSYVGASAKCTENLQVSLTGEDNAYVSELKTADIVAAAATNADGSKLQPVTNSNGHTTAVVSGAETYTMKGHPIYQNFTYDKWQPAPANSYLQFDLYFRVLDVDGKAQKTYLAKKLYFEEFKLNFIPQDGAEATPSETAFKDAMRFEFEQVNDSKQSILLSNTARSAMELGAKLDLNGDGKFDKAHAYEWESEPAEAEYGDKAVKQTSNAYSSYVAPTADGVLAPTSATKELGTTTAALAGQYAKNTALHFKVTVWLEGWDSTGTTAATSIWNAKDYIGSFQLGMTFGVTPAGQA